MQLLLHHNTDCTEGSFVKQVECESLQQCWLLEQGQLLLLDRPSVVSDWSLETLDTKEAV